MPRQQAVLTELGIGADEGTREGHEPSAVRGGGEGDRRRGPSRRDPGQGHRLPRQPRPRDRRRRRLADAHRRGARPRRAARPTTREIGGNPSVAKACGLAKQVLQKDGVEKIAVMMSIVSNTRVDIVARGVIKACLELGKDPAETIAIFRIPGAWEEEGFKILDRYGVEYCDRSVSMHEAAGRAVAKIQGARRHEHPDRRRHHLHRPGHHRARGRQPHARVPRLRLQDRRRRHARAQGPRRPRRAGVRHRRSRSSSTHGRVPDGLGGHRPARLHQGRRAGGDRRPASA